jgi:hypothetical protein
MSDPADKLSAQGPIVASREERQVQCICDALRAGQRTIVVICRDPYPARIPDAALAAYANSASRVLRFGRPLPKLLELQEIIGAAAGVEGGRGMAPQALARLLQTAEPRQSVVLVIDDADCRKGARAALGVTIFELRGEWRRLHRTPPMRMVPRPKSTRASSN